MKHCYQCDAEVSYLFGDSRCGKCTRLDPEQVRGERGPRFVVVVATRHGSEESDPMSFKEASALARELAAKNKAPVRVVKA